MKKLSLFLVVVVFGINLTAQIKIFPGGKTIVGDLGAPIPPTKLTIIGNTSFLSANALYTSAASINGNNIFSTPTNPDYTWLGSTNTGIFHPSTFEMGFSINGTQRLLFAPTGKSYFTATPTSPAADGTINALNININERAIAIKHNANADWFQAVNVDLSRPLNVGYRCTYPGTVGWYVTGAGWMFSMNSYIGSDQSLKTNVSTITNALQTITQLHGVKYNLLGEVANPGLYGGSVSQYYGFLAQETQTAIPGNGVVKSGEDGKFLYISYDMIVPFLVEAVKQLKSQNDTLKQLVNNCCKSNSGNHNGQGGRLTNYNFSENNTSSESFLMQNTPNPFSRETTIKYFIAEKEAVSSMLIFDMNGKLLRTFKLNGFGNGTMIINSNDFQPGMYFYSLIINSKEIDTKKMILTE